MVDNVVYSALALPVSAIHVLQCTIHTETPASKPGLDPSACSLQRLTNLRKRHCSVRPTCVPTLYLKSRQTANRQSIGQQFSIWPGISPNAQAGLPNPAVLDWIWLSRPSIKVLTGLRVPKFRIAGHRAGMLQTFRATQE